MKTFRCTLTFIAALSVTIALLSTTLASAKPSQQPDAANLHFYYTPNNIAKKDDLWYYRLQFVVFLMHSKVGNRAFTAKTIRSYTRGTDPIPHRWGEALDALAKEGRIFKEEDSSGRIIYFVDGKQKYDTRGDSSNFYIVDPDTKILQ